jgi:hypothetical protein
MGVGWKFGSWFHLFVCLHDHDGQLLQTNLMARKDRFNGDDLKRLINWSRELSSLSLKETVAFIKKCPRTDQEMLLSWCRSDTMVAYPLILSDPLMSGQSFVGLISRPSSPAYTDA